MKYNYLSIPKIQSCSNYSLGTDKQLYLTHQWVRDYLSMQGLKFIHICKSVQHAGHYDMHPRWRHQMETFFALLALSAGNSPVTGEFPSQRPVALMFSLIDARINLWVNNREAGDLRRHRAHYNVNVMIISQSGFAVIKIDSFIKYLIIIKYLPLRFENHHPIIAHMCFIAPFNPNRSWWNIVYGPIPAQTRYTKIIAFTILSRPSELSMSININLPANDTTGIA